MRLLILSDLHVEVRPFGRSDIGLADEAFDLVVLAGDIHNDVAALHWARATFPRHRIVQVAGNHEFYGTRLPDCRQRLGELAVKLGIDLLDEGAVVIDGVEFLGCTLWTDFAVFAPPSQRPIECSIEEAMRANDRLIVDYRAIEMNAPQMVGASPDATARLAPGSQAAGGQEGPGEPVPGRPFRPEDARSLHLASRAWLEAQLGRPAAGPRVVVTHHLPAWASVEPRFERSVTNAAFVSNLDALVGEVDLWIHGHTHCSRRYGLGRARVICNPRGYPLRRAPDEPPAFENPAFDAGLVVTL